MNELGPPGVRVGAFSVGDAGAPLGGGAGELADGEGATELLVGSGVLVGFSSSLLQPALVAAIPTIAAPPSSRPIRRDISREFIVESFLPPRIAARCHHRNPRPEVRLGPKVVGPLLHDARPFSGPGRTGPGWP